MAQTSKGMALVTGASSGIGAVYADRLARRGHDLVLVARSKHRLDELARRIADATGCTVDVVAADLGTRDGVASVAAILREDSRITTLVNNAGIGATKPLLESDADAMEAMIALNVTALMHLTYAAAPFFVARGGGTIVNISSIVAIGPEILNGVYGGTKAFVLALTRSLHHELHDRGLRLQAVLPGATSTDFWQAAGTPVENLPDEIVMPVDAMVDAALTGLDMGELATIPSLPEAGDWDRFEAARQALLPNLSRAIPADRYRAQANAGEEAAL